ncbi:MAG: FkbM family methyltransferase [Deltaproteobacteria bacterium]|nr:FkbM family methyltransferase [Deltaproteobacteria bacterium]
MNKLGLVKDDPLLFIAKNNIKVEVPQRLHHEFKEIFMENAYSIGLRKKVKKNATIIDIGANVGFFTMFVVSKYPNATVYSYEPIYSNFETLIRNKELNNTKKITCFNEAVCGHNGMIKIYFDDTDSFTTSATIVNNDNLPAIEISCLTLAEVFKRNNLNKCDLLKLDCEGAEYDILFNTPKDIFDKIDQMAIEVHSGKKEKENLYFLKEFLLKLNFELFQFADKPHMLWAYRANK